MNDNFDNYDSDPADCNGYAPDKTSGATINTESSDEFIKSPQEYKQGAQNSEMQDSSTDDTMGGLFNSPGIIAPLGDGSDVSDSDEYSAENSTDETSAASDISDTENNKTDLGGLYDTDKGSQDGCDGDGCGIGNSDEEYGTDGISPEDETAATVDGCDCNSTVAAREKCALDDYEIISDVLGSEKQLVKLYSTALCESAEESLRGVICDNLIECAKDQYSTFEYMEKRGLYPMEQAPEDKIAQAKSTFSPICDCNDN